MSNSLAIAAVTEALKAQLLAVAQGSVPGVRVTTGRPLAQDPVRPTVNLYLYNIRFSTPLRNSGLPTFGAQGTLVRRAEAALNLCFLISFYGDHARQEPQILMGAVVASLHAKPILDATVLGRVIDTVEFLRNSDLDLEEERIGLTPTDLPMDEMSRLWSTFQVPHVPSVAYEAGIVMLDDRPHAERTPVADVPGT